MSNFHFQRLRVLTKGVVSANKVKKQMESAPAINAVSLSANAAATDCAENDTLALRKRITIFLLVFGLTFFLQFLIKKSFFFCDADLWADQIKFFLTDNSKQFDFYSGYGHPGTTIVESGIILHLLGFTYHNAVVLSTSIFIAFFTAASSVSCLMLSEKSFWWLTTAVMLNFSKFTMYSSTPTTEIMMAAVVFAVLFTSLLIKPGSIDKRWGVWAWGGLVGVMAATRYDVALLLCVPLVLVIWRELGGKSALTAVMVGGLTFCLADPYMWFMPKQHLLDLAHKFTMHHEKFSIPSSISPWEYAHILPLVLLSLIWTVFLLLRRHIPAIPAKVLVICICVTGANFVVLASSSYQAIRYISPLFTLWEVLLPLYVFTTLDRHERYAHVSRKQIVLFISISQVLMSYPMFLALRGFNDYLLDKC